MRRTTRRIVLAVTMTLVAGAGATAEAGILVGPQQTYYDNSNGTLAAPVALPGGATYLQFSVTGSVVTAGGGPQLSPDGLDQNGNAQFNFTNTYYGSSPTYNGVSIGRTTGTDPALFGIFFNPSFAGTAPDSANFRSDASPDLRTALTYTPALNQPFFIGDGYTGNDAYGAGFSGSQQTFIIPTGATELLLGLGADPNMADNSGGFMVNISSNGAVPEPATLTSGLVGLTLALGSGWRRRQGGGAAA